MEIPQAFLETMRGLLGAEYSAFEAAFLRQPPVRGLRVNTLKLPAEEFAAISPYPLTPSPLCRDGFILHSDDRVGLHSFHHAGLFYMQEPSASSVIEALDPSPGMTVLDARRQIHASGRAARRTGCAGFKRMCILARTAAVLQSGADRCTERGRYLRYARCPCRCLWSLL